MHLTCRQLLVGPRLLYSTLYPKEAHFNTFANKADPDQATLFAYRNMIRYSPTLVDLISNFFVLCTNVKVYLYNYS